MPEATPRVKVYSGSVKDVFAVPGKSHYLFSFSDRYSIFDWGEMPDALPGKGEALAVMGDLFFRYLGDVNSWSSWQIPERYPKFWRDSLTTSTAWKKMRTVGLAHHSLGLVDDANHFLPLGKRSNVLAVEAMERPPVKNSTENGKITWDYSNYSSRPDKVLVPLEVVFRFGAPEGSSFLERCKLPGYARSFGFTEKINPGDLFPFPVVEFFTKLEPTDRFLTTEEALAVAALTQAEMDKLVALTLIIALRLKDVFGQLGLELWDGKFEFAFSPGEDGRDFRLVDSIGPDELRLIGPGGVHFSKEFLRRVYRGGAWYEAVEKSKKLAKERGQKDWKKICIEELREKPPLLPKEAFECARLLYPALAEGLAQSMMKKSLFADQPTVSELCKRLEEIR